MTRPENCETCGAAPGMPCQTGSGAIAARPHKGRDTSVPVTSASMLLALTHG